MENNLKFHEINKNYLLTQNSPKEELHNLTSYFLRITQLHPKTENINIYMYEEKKKCMN